MFRSYIFETLKMLYSNYPCFSPEYQISAALYRMPLNYYYKITLSAIFPADTCGLQWLHFRIISWRLIFNKIVALLAIKYITEQFLLSPNNISLICRRILCGQVSGRCDNFHAAWHDFMWPIQNGPLVFHVASVHKHRITKPPPIVSGRISGEERGEEIKVEAVLKWKNHLFYSIQW